MICTSSFPFDEPTSWEPEHLRKVLCIPEDQLKILNSLPEWSKLNSSSSGSSKESAVLNSQSSQIPPTKLNESQYPSLKNIDLFNKDQEDRRKTIETYVTSTKRRHKSSSAIDSSTNNKILSYPVLARTLSASDIHLGIENLLPKESPSGSKKAILNKTYTLSSISKNKAEVLIANKDFIKILSKSKEILCEDKSSEELLANLKSNCKEMDVVTQMPANLSCVEKNVNNEVKIDIILEEHNELSIHQEASKEIHNSDDTQITTNKNESGDGICYPVYENQGLDGKSDALSGDKVELETVVEPKVLENILPKSSKNLNIQESTNKLESESVILPQAFENNVTNNKDAYVSAQNIESDNHTPNKLADIAKEAVNIESDNHTPNKLAVIVKEAINTLKKLPEQLPLPKNNSLDNDSVNAENSSNIIVIEETQLLRQDVAVSNTSSDPKAAAAVKRKSSESKKNSKKRKSFSDKKSNDPRSIKRAGEITYSFEEIKIMLDLAQQFL